MWKRISPCEKQGRKGDRIMNTFRTVAARIGYLITWPGYVLYKVFRYMERIEIGNYFTAITMFFLVAKGCYELYLDKVDILVILAKNIFFFAFIGYFGGFCLNYLMTFLTAMFSPIYKAHIKTSKILNKEPIKIKNASPYFVYKIK